MTLLDTHIWVWWALGDSALGKRTEWLDSQPTDSLGISVFSIWEVAKLVQKGRLKLPFDATTWVDRALAETAVEVVPISKCVALDSNNLPEGFHQDPADQIIVSTARVLNCELLTVDGRILLYPPVKTITV